MATEQEQAGGTSTGTEAAASAAGAPTPRGMHAVAPIEVLRKIREVAASLGRIKKGGRNKAQDYEYVQEADVTDAVRTKALEKGLLIESEPEEIKLREIPRQNGGVMTIARVRMWFRLTDLDTGTYLDRWYIGEGSDTLDKAIYKGMTGARKYFLLHVFMLASGDDPEKGGGKEDGGGKAPKNLKDKPPPTPPGGDPNVRITKTMRDRLVEIAKAAGHTPDQVRTFLWDKYSLESSADILNNQYNEIASRLALKQALVEGGTDAA